MHTVYVLSLIQITHTMYVLSLIQSRGNVHMTSSKYFGALDPSLPLSVPNPRKLPSIGQKLANPFPPPQSRRHKYMSPYDISTETFGSLPWPHIFFHWKIKWELALQRCSPRETSLGSHEKGGSVLPKFKRISPQNFTILLNDCI